MSKIKLTDVEIALLDALIAAKREEQGAAGGVEFDEAELKFFKAAVARTVGKVGRAVKEAAKKVLKAVTKTPEIATEMTETIGAALAEENASAEELKKFLEENNPDGLTLDQLIEVRKIVTKHQKD